MKKFTYKVKSKLYQSDIHPYGIFENKIEEFLLPSFTLLDAGCGRTADLLARFEGKANRLIGVDIVNFDLCSIPKGIEILNCNLEDIKLRSESVDLVISRSVLEHLKEPLLMFLEISRILRRGGYFIFLAPNLNHYTVLFSKLIPNKFHPWIVSKIEGREEQDVFPTYYKSNSSKAIKILAKESGFDIISTEYIGQYPNYFMFNTVLFLLASSYEKMINRSNIFKYLRGWLLGVLRKS